MPEKYDPNVHHRCSMRLAGYDYSQKGWYFVTICTQDRRCMFGVIAGSRMDLNDAGLMIESWWKKLTGKFPIVRTDGYIVMPNHFHGIINVGAAPCGRPNVEGESGQPHGVAPTQTNKNGTNTPFVETAPCGRSDISVLCPVFLNFRLTKSDESGLIVVL